MEMIRRFYSVGIEYATVRRCCVFDIVRHLEYRILALGPSITEDEQAEIIALQAEFELAVITHFPEAIKHCRGVGTAPVG